MKARRILHKQGIDWDEFARADHRFAICPDDPSLRSRWQDEEFWDTGRKSVGRLLEYLARQAPELCFDSALDFGCGVGRETRPMADAWRRVIGVDVSEEMIAMARRHHAEAENCSFLVIDEPDLESIADQSIDFVRSHHTLSCIPREGLIEAYVREFVRILRVGGYAFFQLPARVPLLRRIKIRRHVYHAFRRLGVPSDFLYHRLNLHPTSVRAVKKERVLSWFEGRADLVDLLDEGGMDTRYLVRKL